MADITRTDSGFEVDAGLLGSSFGIEPAQVPALLRAARITSRFETGEAEDAGRYRLTFYYGGRGLRLTVDADGALLKQATFDMPHRAPGGQ